MPKAQLRQRIPTKLSLAQFEQFVLSHLSADSRAPTPKLPLHTMFNYILCVLYTGCQWKALPIEKDREGSPEIHYTRIYSVFRRWVAAGCMNTIFAGSVLRLHQENLLDVSIIHGDGTTTTAKKGGDKVVVFCDRNCNVIAPLVAAPGNRNESPMLGEALPEVIRFAKTIELDLKGCTVSLDGVYDCPANRKAIFNPGMKPNINPNPRGRTTPKRSRKPLFKPEIFEERFNTSSVVSGWEDKFRRLLLRFDRISERHYAFKTLAYTLINLRHFCRI